MSASLPGLSHKMDRALVDMMHSSTSLGKGGASFVFS